MNIGEINNAIKTLETICNPNQMTSIKRTVGDAVLMHHESKCTSNQERDLKVLNIDMKLDISELDI